MTDTTDTTEVEDPTVEEATTAETQEVEESPNAEAAKWRTRLRETEAERDALTGQLEAARREIVASALQAHRLHERATDDFLALDPAGASRFFDTTGALDTEGLTQALADTRGERPHWFAEAKPPSAAGLRGGLDPTTNYSAEPLEQFHQAVIRRES